MEGVLAIVLGISLPIIITLGAFLMVGYLRKFDNIERMAIMERGLSPDLFKRGRAGFSVALRFSLLLIGAGIGLLMGYWLDRTFDMEEPGYFSMLFIFGGIGLGLSYLVEEKKNKRD